jgi:hypothetical protein
MRSIAMKWALTRNFRTRTQIDSRQPQRRARRPQLESLEGRIVQSIIFGSYSNGTFAYSTANGKWREVTPWTTYTMTEGSSGTLFASYNGHGIYKYTYGNNKLVRINTDTASVLSAARDNTLFAGLYSSRGNVGTAEYTGRWRVINVDTPYEIAAVARDQAYVTYSDQGLMADNHGAWVTVTSKVPTAISATSDSTLFVSFRDGGNIAYKFDGRWHSLGNFIFDTVNAGDDNSFIALEESRGGNYTIVDAEGSTAKVNNQLSRAIGNDGTAFVWDNAGATWLLVGRRGLKIRGQEANALA